MADLSIIYLTLDRHPAGWSEFQLDTLIEAADGAKIYPVTAEGVPSHLNMYRQLLKACQSVDTEFIATAEDDVLYSKEHFKLRPKGADVMYDMARWSLYWWTPIYSVKQRISNCTLIARREPYIEALSRKLERLKEGSPYVAEVGRYENQLGLTPTPIDTRQYAEVPVIHFNSPQATDPLTKQVKKRLGQLKAYDIPHWGPAQDIIDRYMKDKNGDPIHTDTGKE